MLARRPRPQADAGKVEASVTLYAAPAGALANGTDAQCRESPVVLLRLLEVPGRGIQAQHLRRASVVVGAFEARVPERFVDFPSAGWRCIRMGFRSCVRRKG